MVSILIKQDFRIKIVSYIIMLYFVQDSNVDLPSASRQSMVCRDMRSAEEITEADLSMVATVVSFKRYDSINVSITHSLNMPA